MTHRWIWGLAIAMLAGGLLTACPLHAHAAAPSGQSRLVLHMTAPAPTAVAHGQNDDKTPLNVPPAPTQGHTNAQMAGPNPFDLLLKLVIVVVLLIVTMRVLKAVYGRRTADQGAPAGGGLTLYAEPVGAGQRVMLVDLGSRLLVVGGTTTTLTPLSEVTDPAEMETLRARWATEKTAALPSFGAALSDVLSRGASQGAKRIRLSESVRALDALRKEVEKR